MLMKTIKVIDSAATSDRIKELLKKQGLRPKDVQEELELECVQTVYKWMNPNSKTIPSLDKLIHLAALLQVSIEEILVLNEIKK